MDGRPTPTRSIEVVVELNMTAVLLGQTAVKGYRGLLVNSADTEENRRKQNEWRLVIV